MARSVGFAVVVLALAAATVAGAASHSDLTPGTEHEVAQLPGHYSPPLSLTPLAGGFLASWVAENGPAFSRLDVTGTPVGGPVSMQPPPDRRITTYALDYDTKRKTVLLVYHLGGSNQGEGTYSQRLDLYGSPLTAPRPVAAGAEVRALRYERVRDRYLLVASESAATRTILLDAGGAQLGPARPLLASPAGRGCMLAERPLRSQWMLVCAEQTGGLSACRLGPAGAERGTCANPGFVRGVPHGAPFGLATSTRANRWALVFADKYRLRALAYDSGGHVRASRAYAREKVVTPGSEGTPQYPDMLGAGVAYSPKAHAFVAVWMGLVYDRFDDLGGYTVPRARLLDEKDLRPIRRAVEVPGARRSQGQVAVARAAGGVLLLHDDLRSDTYTYESFRSGIFSLRLRAHR